MKKLLNPWGPWDKNPSKPENFYDINDLREEEIVEKNITEEKISEEQIEEHFEEEFLKEEEIIENIKENTSLKEKDPYEDILKDLK